LNMLLKAYGLRCGAYVRMSCEWVKIRCELRRNDGLPLRASANEHGFTSL
jgi:hypothetical protein